MIEMNPKDLSWCVRRLPKPVRELLVIRKDEAVVAGGFIRSCIANEPINDVDIFAPSDSAASTFAMELSRHPGMRRITTDNAYTITGSGLTLQVIHRWTFDSPEKVIPSFDFTIARAAIWCDGTKGRHPTFRGIVDDHFYQDLAAKRLTYCSPERNEDAGGSMLRVLKFYQRGYRIPLDSLGAVMARMFVAVDQNKINITDEGEVAHVLRGLLLEVDPNSVDSMPITAPGDDMPDDESDGQ